MAKGYLWPVARSVGTGSAEISAKIFSGESAISHSAENLDENQSNNLAEDISAENVNRTNET